MLRLVAMRVLLSSKRPLTVQLCPLNQTAFSSIYNIHIIFKRLLDRILYVGTTLDYNTCIVFISCLFLQFSV